MRHHTNKSRNADRHDVLHARVWSPRMARIGFFKLLFRSFKPLCLLVLLALAGLGIRYGLRRALYENPDFCLQSIDLNPNSGIDELDFVKLTGINLRANLFQIDCKALANCLRKVPQLADAQVQRQLPGTLVVRVTARTPRAWISCPAAGIPRIRAAGAMLVDEHDIAYQCPPHQLETAAALPIIALPARNKQPITSGKKVLQPELQRCLRLLASANENDPDTPQWIDSIQQTNAWSMCLTTRGGTAATVGLSDHTRQLTNLRSALRHAQTHGYVMATINLIPRENVPITIANPNPQPPPAPVDPTPAADDLTPTASATRDDDDEKQLPRAIPVAVPVVPAKTTPKNVTKIIPEPTTKVLPKTNPASKSTTANAPKTTAATPKTTSTAASKSTAPKNTSAAASKATTSTAPKTTSSAASKATASSAPKTTSTAASKATATAAPKMAQKAIPRAIPVALPVAIPVTDFAPKPNHQARRIRDEKSIPNRD